MLPDETLEQARARIDGKPNSHKIFGSTAGQALIEAINSGRGSEVWKSSTPPPAIDRPGGKTAPNARLTAAQREVRHLIDRGMDIEAAELAQAAGVDLTRPRQELREIPLDTIDIGPNVRTDPGELELLAESIRAHGVIQPVKAIGTADGRYRLVWGQRRVLASRLAGHTTIPALVLGPANGELHDRGPKRSIEQLLENLQRADLNDLDEARALREVLDADPKLSQAELARRLGRDPSWISNTLVILDVSPAVQALVAEGAMTGAHVKALRGLAPKTQLELARDIAANGYSARRAEEEAQSRKRQADAERERAAATIKEREAQKAGLQAAIAAFETKKIPKAARIVVDSGYYGQGTAAAGHIAKLIEAAGYANVAVAKQYGEIKARPAGGVCDCNVWKAAETDHGSYDGKGRYVRRFGVSITKGCINRKHEQAKLNADEQVRLEKSALESKVQEHVKRLTGAWALPEARAITVERILAEAALFSLLSYSLPTWSVAHGGVRTRPWDTIHRLSIEELATELAKAISGDFRDHAGFHVDWPTLADELGIQATP